MGHPHTSMNDRWREIESLFVQAIECPLEDRPQFLDRACGDDQALREELESLLANDAPEDRLVQIPTGLNARAFANGESEDGMAGRRIGVYRLVRLIGHGGM